MAADPWFRSAHLAAHGGRLRGTQLAVGISLRASRRRVAGDRRRRRGIRRYGDRSSADPGRQIRPKRRSALGRHANAARERLEHVGQEHAPAHGRHQYGPRAGRRSGACCGASDHAARHRRHASDSGFAPRRPVAFLRRDHAAPRASRTPLAARCRCSFSWTSSSMEPTRTTGSPAHPACCAASSTAARSA